MAKRIYVGNLPFSASEAQVRKMFAAYGTVNSVSLKADRGAGSSFGFVEFADPTAASAALRGLGGKSLGGNRLKLSERPG